MILEDTMAKQSTARKRSTNPKAPANKGPKLEVVRDAPRTDKNPDQNPKRRRKRLRNSGGRRKNMSTAGKIAIGVGIVLVGVPLVMLAVGAVVIGKIASDTIKDFPTPTPTPTSPSFPTYPTQPVYPGMS